MKNKMKRQPIECEKISANCTPDKGLISKMYKKHIQLKNRKKKKSQTHKKTNSLKKWPKYQNRHLFQRRYLMAMYMKRCSTSPTNRKLYIKTVIRYHLISVTMAIIKKMR